MGRGNKVDIFYINNKDALIFKFWQNTDKRPLIKFLYHFVKIKNKKH